MLQTIRGGGDETHLPIDLHVEAVTHFLDQGYAIVGYIVLEY